MIIPMIRILVRKSLLTVKLLARLKSVLVWVSILSCLLVLWPVIWWFAEETSRALLVPPPPGEQLYHYRRNRTLRHYLNKIELLIEPSSISCGSLDEVPVLILVSSAPSRFQQRQAVRITWAKHQPTYFVLGLHGASVDEHLVDIYIEAKQYHDLIVFDFHDHYQNLTLKTALMLQWTLARCPQVQFLFKTDDDVLVNPWTLRRVLKENVDARLVGYRINNSVVHRSEYTKWYMPRWLYYQDEISNYLSGTGYLINGDYLETILKTASQVPLINLEDVYFTYLVAHMQLGYTLTHDRRLSPYKPWLKMTRLYWDLASVHSLQPEEMVAAWSKVEDLGGSVSNDTNACWFYNWFLKEYSDYALY